MSLLHTINYVRTHRPSNPVEPRWMWGPFPWGRRGPPNGTSSVAWQRQNNWRSPDFEIGAMQCTKSLFMVHGFIWQSTAQINLREREGHVESHWYRFLFLSQDESYWIGRPRGILIGRQHIHEKVAIRLSGSICSMGVQTASCESMWKHHKYLIVSVCFCKESNVKADLFNLFQIIFHNHWLVN
jgi:hypothetical protein